MRSLVHLALHYRLHLFHRVQEVGVGPGGKKSGVEGQLLVLHVEGDLGQVIVHLGELANRLAEVDPTSQAVLYFLGLVQRGWLPCELAQPRQHSVPGVLLSHVLFVDLSPGVFGEGVEARTGLVDKGVLVLLEGVDGDVLVETRKHPLEKIGERVVVAADGMALRIDEGGIAALVEQERDCSVV